MSSSNRRGLNEPHPLRCRLDDVGSGVIHESGAVDPVVFGQAMHLPSISCEETVSGHGHGHGSQPELPEEPSSGASSVRTELLLDLEDLLRQGIRRGDALSKIATAVLNLVGIDAAVSAGIYSDRVDDLLECQEICRSLYALCGEHPEAEQLMDQAQALL